MTSLSRVIVDTSQTDAIAGVLASIDDAALGRANLAAVNTVTARAERNAKAKMLAGINLPQSYVESRLHLEPATDPQSPVASVVAPFAGTGLGLYSAVQVSAPVRFTNAAINARLGKVGDNPRKPGSTMRWKPRIGDAGRGIAPDAKQAGISVEVRRGERKTISYAFVIPGIQSRDGAPVVFENAGPGGKTGRGKLRSLSSLSVHQLFRHALDDAALAAIADDLQQTTVVTTAHELERLIAQRL